MKVLITGGAGFVGQRLAMRLIERNQLTSPDGSADEIDAIQLFDVAEPSFWHTGLPVHPKVEMVTGDISDRATVFGLVDRDDISIFHLASVVSGGGELDFDLAMRVNMTGGMNLFEAVRARASTPRLVYTSSVAAFGGDGMPEIVGDFAKQTPQTTYGMTKACLEMMVNDYSRKGFFDGRSARLPTVIVRPGKANMAASSFASGLFREPLKGEDYVVPVRSDTIMPSLGYKGIVEGLIHLHELAPEDLGTDRAVGLPALNVTTGELMAAFERVTAGQQGVGKLSQKVDDFIQKICDGWPKGIDNSRSEALKFPKEETIDEIVRYYIEDYVDGNASV